MTSHIRTLCEFKAQYSKRNNCKSGCLFLWPHGICSVPTIGLFSQWVLANDVIERQNLAVRIQDLPINPIHIKRYELTLEDIDPKEVLK